MADGDLLDEVIERETSQRNRAPALEKGLDVLELLSGAERPMTMVDLTQALGRSVNELFRMIKVLEHRGYIDQTGSGYIIAPKLFMLGMQQAPIRNLLEIALPSMRQLSERIGQSCHMVVRVGGDIVVVARMESDQQIGFSVRVGWRQPLASTCSGTILYAFQPPEVRTAWERTFVDSLTDDQLAAFLMRVRIAEERGYEQRMSGFVKGITDLSCPLMRGGRATAALTIPFVETEPLTCSLEATIEHLKATAQEISALLHTGDERL